MKKNDLLEVVDVNEGRSNISLTNIFFIIADQVKVIIIVPFILCLFTSIYVLFIASPVYMSISKIMSSTGNSGSLNQALGIAAQFGFSLPTGSSETKWAYKDIIKSRTLAKKIIKGKKNNVWNNWDSKQ